MGKVLLPAVAAFLLALNAGTAAVVWRAKSAHALAVAVAEKTTPAPADGAAHGGASGGHAGAPGDSAAHGRALAHAGGVSATPDPARDPGVRAVMDSLARAESLAVAAQHAPATAGAKRAVAHGAEPAHAAPASTPGAPTIPVAPASLSDTTKERRLAKVFAAMQAKDAARVLEQMADGDVQTILGYLGDRQAGAILGHFPPTRVALVGRAAMRTSAR